MTQRSSTPSRGAIKFEFSWTASRQQTSSALPMPLPAMSSFILMLGFVPSNWAKLTIAFKLPAPSRLYWAGRPAMREVQALHWVRDLLPTDQNRILKRLQSIIPDPTHGAAIRQDLAAGIHTLPTWMQDLVRNATFQRHPSNGASKISAVTNPEIADQISVIRLTRSDQPGP